MKIIRKARKPKEVTTECDCGCKFRFAAHEAKYHSDSRDGDYYMIQCPECKDQITVSAERFR